MTQFVPTLLAAAAGGALGACLRVMVVAFLVPGPVGILVLNVLGSLLLGFVLVALGEKSPLAVVFLGGGVLGALTTFSTFAGDVVRLAAGQPGMAALYIAGSVGGAAVAFLVGGSLARSLA